MNKILFIFLVSLQLSCSSSNNNNNNTRAIIQVSEQLYPITIKIDNSDPGTVRKLEDLFEEPSFVKLETTNNNLIGQISQVLFLNNMIIVVDNVTSHSICVFDINGKFKTKIGNRGQGAGEYISCYHVALVPNSDIIAVLDDKLAKIHYYKIDGTYLSSKKFNFHPISMEFINSETIAYAGLNNVELNGHDLIITDSMNNLVSSGFKGLYKNTFSYNKGNIVSKFGNTVFYNPNFNDTIFEIGSNDIHARYHIDIVNNKFPIINDKTTDKDISDYFQKYLTFSSLFFDFEKAAIFYIHVPNSVSPFAFYSKELNETYKWDLEVYNPYYLFIELGKPIARYKENTLVYSVQANMINYAKSVFEDQLKKKLITKEKVDELFNGLTDESNPVLFFYNINIKKDIDAKK
jgi:hypothetical protein